MSRSGWCVAEAPASVGTVDQDPGDRPQIAPHVMEHTFRCSICEKPVRYEGPLPALYPFCSARCKMVDLGRWFAEQYSIDRDILPGELGGEYPSWSDGGPGQSERGR